ncbi:MAG: hypothetical protein LC659_06745 [Myxococcales bacterium]|nr:hypothetical protein [Myxococcales bacterium]
MTVISIVVVWPTSARADQALPPSLIERALRNDSPGAPPSDRAIAAAEWIPELRLRALIERADLPTRRRVDALFFGELIWPLGRAPVGDNIEAARDRRQRSAARDSLVERIAAAWHARSLVDDAADDVAARLAEEEADATLDALTGDAVDP